MKITSKEEARLLVLEAKNAKHRCSKRELNELQSLLDKSYDQGQHTKTQHTPGKVIARVTYHKGEPIGACVSSGARRIADCEDGLTQDECEANARRIALCWNSHDDLLTALNQALTRMEIADKKGPFKFSMEINNARDAIAKTGTLVILPALPARKVKTNFHTKPESLVYLLRLAGALLDKGKPTEAVDALNRALAKNMDTETRRQVNKAMDEAHIGNPATAETLLAMILGDL